jgi:hypothetical protein
MPVDVKTKYGSLAQAITISLGGLASGSARQSVYVDNSVNLFLDALVQVSILTNAAGVSATGYVNVYAYGSADGTTYSGGASGADAAITLPANGSNLRLIGTMFAGATATTYRAIFSVAAAFGGVLPPRWGIVVEQVTGAALDATGGNHAVTYSGVYANAA